MSFGADQKKKIKQKRNQRKCTWLIYNTPNWINRIPVLVIGWQIKNKNRLNKTQKIKEKGKKIIIICQWTWKSIRILSFGSDYSVNFFSLVFYLACRFWPLCLPIYVTWKFNPSVGLWNTIFDSTSIPLVPTSNHREKKSQQKEKQNRELTIQTWYYTQGNRLLYNTSVYIFQCVSFWFTTLSINFLTSSSTVLHGIPFWPPSMVGPTYYIFLSPFLSNIRCAVY